MWGHRCGFFLVVVSGLSFLVIFCQGSIRVYDSILVRILQNSSLKIKSSDSCLVKFIIFLTRRFGVIFFGVGDRKCIESCENRSEQLRCG